MLTSSARETLRRRRDGDHRRDPRDGHHQARRAPRRCRSSGSRRSPTGRRSASACRPPSARWRRSPASSAATTTPGAPRPVTIVDAGIRKPLEVEVVVPVEDMGDLGRRAGRAAPVRQPAAAPRRGQHLAEHLPADPRAGARAPLDDHLLQRPPPGRAAGRQAQRARRGAGHRRRPRDRRCCRRARQGPPRLARPRAAGRHRGPAQARRRCAPSSPPASLELGIDMGAVDLVIQVESPGAVSRGLQRIGRAGHSVGEPSKGTIYPKHRGDLLEAAVVVRRMLDGADRVARATCATRSTCSPSRSSPTSRSRGDAPVAELAALVRRCANFAELSDELLANVLDLLAGRYPSEEFSELRPRIVWDRVNDTVRARDGSKRLAVTSGGTIPDRGLFGVFLPDGTRVGELDEEMVYESRPGRDVPARRVARGGSRTSRSSGSPSRRRPGEPGKMPFWHGDRPGRPLELGRALGAFVREIRALPPATALARLTRATTRSTRSRPNNVRAVPRRAGRGHRRRARRPHDRGRAVPRRDRRLAGVHPQPVRHAGARAVGDGDRAPADRPLRHAGRDDVGRRRHRPAPARGRRRAAARRADDRPRRHRRAGRVDAAADVAVLGPLPRVRRRGRCCCRGAGPTGARRCGSSASGPPTCWRWRRSTRRSRSCSRRRASACRTCSTCRRCARCSASCAAGPMRVVTVDTAKASAVRVRACCSTGSPPYMYEGDAPLAERRAAALALDRDLLRDLLGAEELRELLDPGVLADVELELQCLADGRRARSADELHDVLRKVGDLTAGRGRPALRGRRRARTGWPTLVDERRAIEVGVAGERRGTSPPRTRPATATRSGARCRSGCRRRSPTRCRARSRTLVGRYARTHGPFLDRRGRPPVRRARPSASPARSPRSRPTTGWCAASSGPTACSREWCDVDVLRQLRRRSLAALRREVEPVEQRGATPASCRRGTASPAERRGLEALVEALGMLAGRADRGLHARDRRAAVAGRAATGPPTSTSCARRARWCGSAPARSARTTAGSGCASPTSCRCWRRRWEPPRPPEGALHDAIRALLRRARRELLEPAPRGRRPAPPTPSCWPRCGTSCGPARSPTTRWRRCARCSRRGGVAHRSAGASDRARPAASRAGSPASGRRPAPGGGASSRRCSSRRPTPTEAAHAQALQLLERYGVVTREAVLAEGVVGGYASVYGVLKVLEERGQARRGYFVAGLGAAQFSLPGAVDRLRSARERARRRSRTPSACRRRSCSRPPTRRSRTARRSPGPTPPGRPARSAARSSCCAQGVPLVWFDRAVAPPRHVPGRPRRPGVGRGARRAGHGPGASAASRSARSTASPVAPIDVAAVAAARRVRRRLPGPRRSEDLLSVTASSTVGALELTARSRPCDAWPRTSARSAMLDGSRPARRRGRRWRRPTDTVMLAPSGARCRVRRRRCDRRRGGPRSVSAPGSSTQNSSPP